MTLTERDESTLRQILPFEVDIAIPAENVDAALAALRELGETGMGSIVHDQVPEDERDLAWWCLEWGWSTEWLASGMLRFRGLYGDWNFLEDDIRFFEAIAPFVDPRDSVKIVVAHPGDRIDFDRPAVIFEWRFGEGVARRWRLEREVIYLDVREELTD